MPRFWSAEIDLGDEAKFLVQAKPSDFRGSSFSWIPYRAGDQFIADIDISAGSALNQDKPVQIICSLREPDGS